MIGRFKIVQGTHARYSGAMEAWLCTIVSVLLIALLIWGYTYSKKKQWEDLMAKYGDESLVRRLVRKQIWVGMTEHHLLDSYGRPNKVDQKVLKTKTKETWKYHEVAKNRFSLKVMLEDGVVIGWDDKR